MSTMLSLGLFIDLLEPPSTGKLEENDLVASGEKGNFPAVLWARVLVDVVFLTGLLSSCLILFIIVAVR